MIETNLIMKRILLSALLVGALTGCSKETPEQPAGNSREIRISTAIDGVDASKSVVLGSETQAEVQVLRKDNATSAAPTDFSGTPVSVTRETTGNLTFATAPTYDLNNNYAFFAAYWPKGTPGSDKVTWAIDGATDIIATEAWNAGNYAAPVTTGMTFSHQLAQLEVVCTADPAGTTSLDVVKAAWGKITNIELVNTSNTVDMAYDGLSLTFGEATQTLALKKADYDTALASFDLAKSNTTVNAAGMFAPGSGTATIKLKVTSEKVTGGKEIEVQLKQGGTTDKGFEKGLKHTVTLTFGASTKDIAVTATTITAWSTGYEGSGSLEN